MEAHNLKTASAYINNLLLARGLLRDGKAIEFAHPSRGAGVKEQTMAHIINVVHDLILKRDVSAWLRIVYLILRLGSAIRSIASPWPRRCALFAPSQRAR